MTEYALEARGLARQYGTRWAVQDMDLQLRSGEILGLLGPNGAGKSTTMGMLSGCLAATKGQVFLGGVSLQEHPTLAKKNLGYLPEQPPVYPELSVDEYLKFCAQLHGIPKKAQKNAIESVLEDCGLMQMRTRLIGNLSKGYQQRVGIAQAIIHRPKVVILDEPTVGLDPIQILEIRALIRRLGEKQSVIISSHILSEIEAVCHRVVIIHQGKMVFQEQLSTLQNSAPIIEVGFHHSPNLDQFTQIILPPFANIIQDIRIKKNANLFEIKLKGQDAQHLVDINQFLLAKNTEHQWHLQQLSARKITLEEIFVEKTLR